MEPSPADTNDIVADGGSEDNGRTEKESVSSGSTNSIGYDDFFFGKFCRHIPRILRHQLISKLVNQYVYKMKEADEMPDSAPNRVVSKAGDAGVDFKANTSIYRFHGALLFVDISGFTVLSQKLKVDDLKNHINAYFQKIVDIIDKYEGEIIKFAGDALFIVWQTKVSDIADENFLQASKDATDKAVTCGKEINLECGNYLIRLGSNNSSQGSAKAQNFLRSIENSDEQSAARRSPRKPKSSSRPGSAANKRKTKEPLVTYLNVHAGVSVGVMAGMDVGAQDRFEDGGFSRSYVLLGQPMNDVAIAEGDAGKGEIVISPIAHAILHGFSSLQSTAPVLARETICGVVGGADGVTGSESGAPTPAPEPAPALDPSHPLACGCTLTPSGYYNINTGLEDVLCTVNFNEATAAQNSNNAAVMQMDVKDFEGDKDLQYEFETYAHVIDELMSGYKVVSPLLQKEFADLLKKMTEEPTQGYEVKEEQTDGGSSVTDSSGRRASLEYTEKEVLTEHFFSWAQHCLLDDIAKHVHEVVRKGFSFYQDSRAAPFEKFLRSPELMENFRRELERTSGGGIVRHSVARHARSVGSTSSSHSSNRSSILTSSVSSNSPTASKHNSRADGASVHRNSNGGRHGESFVTKMRQITGLGTLKDRKHNKHQKVLSKDGALVSELRNVIVLFISVKMDHASLFQDPRCDNRREGNTIQTCKVNSFHFLNRTMEEIEADKKLINQFQSCMEVLAEVFHTKGGQLRQFIVDDKGTVCIGTFGLRGSVNYDNAASAIDAADSIVSRLQALGFNASVGVTSGAAYCGLVGSNTRHEYAVMGPSTNLSARLMGRAAEGEIICDTNIRQRDRMHVFASLGAVKAKGYANPVPIFQPHFGDIDDNEAARLSIQNPNSELHGVSNPTSKVFGRKDMVVDMFCFYVCDAVKGGLDELVELFWEKNASEDVTKREEQAYTAEPFDFSLKGDSSKKRSNVLVQSSKKVRFDHHMTIKKFAVMGPNGVGKTAVLNLMQHKLRALVARDEEYYNIAILRHQVGYINNTTLFSAWFCLIRQTLHNIAVALAATGDAHMAVCLAAFQDDDCTPLMDFLKDYLSPMLRPFTSLLTLVGIKFTPRVDSAASQEIVQEKGIAADSLDATEDRPPDLGEMDPESGKTDPMSALDPTDKLQRCAELMVAIIQLHVSITRNVTIYIMDDLKTHDVASQDLGRLISDRVTGVMLLSTYRTSPQGHYEDLRADSISHGQPLTLNDAAGMFAPGVGSFEAAMRSMPESKTFRKADLPPLCESAIKKLLLRISTSFGLNDVGDNVLEKLCEMSAGSPLYATELAKAVCTRYIARECSNHAPETVACSEGMLTIISSMRTDRIEEMVHFRFDKLTEQCQLVLKMAAVASLNGSHFTLSMLTSILDSSDRSESAKLDAMISNTRALLGYLSDPDEDGENSTFTRGNPINSSMDLVQAINDLLESEDFIEFRGDMANMGASMENSHEDGAGSSYNAMLLTTVPTPVTPKPDLTRLQSEGNAYEQHRNDSRTRSSLQQLHFHWKVDMELRAIYDLMLDEQKESLHDRVASFLEQEAQKSDILTATEWYEQAFHWERATAWSSAMTCYFNSGMLLKQQGDAQGAKGHFTAAYRMMDKMRHDAGVNFLDGTRLTTQCAAAQQTAMTCKPMHPAAVQNFSEIEKASREYLLGARNVGMKLEDLHKVFEGSSALLYTGMSVLVRLAQALIGPTTAEYSYRMFEDALDILVLSHRSNIATKLEDADGGQFLLRNDDIGFPVFSGLFLLLLNEQVYEVDRLQRIVAVISLHMAYAAAKPEYEPHLILAYQNKLRLLESVVYMDVNALPAITTYTNTMWMYYDREKHSKDLIHYYNSDRTGNATSVLLKMLYMQGHFFQCDTYLERIKDIAFKLKHFFSSAVAVFAVYPMFLLYMPNSEAQIFMERLVTRESKQMNKELVEPIQIFREALNLTIQHQQYARSGDDAVFDRESALVEGILQARSLVQREKNIDRLNLARRYYIGIEYVAARICYLKALRWELRAAATYKSNTDTIATYQEKAQSYLLLGLEHLTFTPERDERNEQLLFAKANERLLRVQILFKLMVNCVDAEKARIMWTTAHDNVERTIRLAERCNFQLLLLQAGMHLQTLATQVLPPFSAITRDGAEHNTGQNGHSHDASQDHAELCASLQARGATLESVARVYIEKANENSGLELEEIYRSILMQYPSD